MFDLGGTLWYSPPDSVLLDEERLNREQGKRMNAVLARRGVSGVDGVALCGRLWDEYERRVSEDWSVEPDGPAVLDDLLSARGLPCDETFIGELWNESFLGHGFFGTRLHPDTMPALTWARDHGLKVGLLSQRPFGGKFLRRDLEELRIAEFFDVALTTADVGLRKPRPEPFLQVAAALDVAPAETVMVGDMLETDVLGAKRAGMVAVWLNRDGRSADEWDDHYPRHEVSPDYEIRSLDELMDIDFGQQVGQTWR